MSKKVVVLGFVDRLGRHYPRLVTLAVGVLLLVVIVVEVTETDAPLVLYQAF
jgi:hypothetical protein